MEKRIEFLITRVMRVLQAFKQKPLNAERASGDMLPQANLECREKDLSCILSQK